MTKQELRSLIKEEIQKVLSEELVIGDKIPPGMWNPLHPMVKKYKSVLTTAHKIEGFMDEYQNLVNQMPKEGWIILSGGSGMGTRFLKHLPIEALK